MRKNYIWLVGSLVVVMFALTGCGLFSTDEGEGGGEGNPDLTTPGPACTPPACAAGEILQCPDGSCPQGCGVVCVAAVPVTDPGLGAAPGTWEEVDTWLISAWSNQANPAAVRAGLRASGWLDGHDNWRGADLDGDLRDEWIVALTDPDITKATPWGRMGDLWVVNANGIVYRAYEPGADEVFDKTVPEVTGIIDMTNDGKPELVINKTSCGANTCYGNYEVISTIRGGFENIVDAVPPNEDVPDWNVVSVSYPTAAFNDFELDGLVELQVHGGAQGSAGAGIHQTYVEFWSWNGTAVTLKDRFYDPTEFRHHAVYDANRAMENENYEQAILLYEGAINNGNLITPPGFADDDGVSVYAAISQFAAARLVQIDLIEGDIGRAGSRASWLERTYPGTAVTNATIRLLTEWTGEEGNMATLCESIEADLAGFDQPFGPLSNEMGYANPSLSAADFCP
ncbi:MAG: hypothetical protein AAF614_31490 [Chloroflexota bacterium]